jgi:hypothetical protein
MMEHCKQLLKDGGTITGERLRAFISSQPQIGNAVFPEGARSPTGELQDFKPGMFQLALDTGATILPVAVSGTEKA